MRVIAGEFKGRPLLAVPGKSTRPTSDKVKESLFSMIGPYFSGGICLDLYAGTGSLGIEAISRGAEKAIFVDIDRKAIETISTNIEKLKLQSQAEIYKNDAERAISALAKRDIRLDFIFIDPPYAKEKNLLILSKLIQGNVLSHDCIIVVEHDCAHTIDSPSQKLFKWKESQFGDTAMTVFKYQDTNNEER